MADASALHVIILDEMDAIARKRGSSMGDTSGVRDSVVNQLLAKMDGVVEAANVLVSNDGVIKLADFGVSTRHMFVVEGGAMGAAQGGGPSQIAVRGTPLWMAPEEEGALPLNPEQVRVSPRIF